MAFFFNKKMMVAQQWRRGATTYMYTWEVQNKDSRASKEDHFDRGRLSASHGLVYLYLCRNLPFL